MTVVSGIDRDVLAGKLEVELENFVVSNPRSQELFDRSRKSLIGGVPMPWMMRWAGLSGRAIRGCEAMPSPCRLASRVIANRIWTVRSSGRTRITKMATAKAASAVTSSDRNAARFDFVKPVTKCFDKQTAAIRIGNQVILQIGITIDHPDVPEYFVEHTRGAAGDAPGTQFVQQVPRRLPKQANDDLTIGKRRAVIRDLAQAHARRSKTGDRFHQV